MPLINVKVIEGVFDTRQKQEIIKKLTEAMVDVEGENMRAVTWCVVEEVGSGSWGIAGNPLTTEDVQALAAGRQAGT
jgi:4-oxalocrotonate tautomerase